MRRNAGRPSRKPGHTGRKILYLYFIIHCRRELVTSHIPYRVRQKARTPDHQRNGANVSWRLIYSRHGADGETVRTFHASPRNLGASGDEGAHEKLYCAL